MRYAFFFMRPNGAQLKTLAALYDAGTLRPVLDRTTKLGYALRRLPPRDGRAAE